MVAAREIHSGPIRVVDFRCSAGPRDRAFTEHHGDDCVSFLIDPDGNNVEVVCTD